MVPIPAPTPMPTMVPVPAPTPMPSAKPTFVPTSGPTEGTAYAHYLSVAISFAGFDSTDVGTDGSTDEALAIMTGLASVLSISVDDIVWEGITDARRRKLLSKACTITFGITYYTKMDAAATLAHIQGILAAAMSDGSLVAAIQAAASAGREQRVREHEYHGHHGRRRFT